MKKTQDKQKIALIDQLKKIIEQKKELTRKEKELKEKVKTMVPSDNALLAGKNIAIRSTKKRRDIDKKKLAIILTEKELEKVTKESSYETLEIKAA